MTITTKIKEALKKALKALPPTSNGTVIQAVVGSGQDAFDNYPTIRVIPSGMERVINSEKRYLDYKVNMIISIYLDMGDGTIPDEEVITTLCEIQDNIMDKLDNTDWLPQIEGLLIVENSTSSAIDTIITKNGTALYCDITYPITYRSPLD